MDSRYQAALETLRDEPRTWLVTGAAGFIGSSLVERLLAGGQSVVGLDDFSTGHKDNLHSVQRGLGSAAWSRLHFIEGDIRDIEVCKSAVGGCDFVLHQAGLGSVPRSLADPATTNAVNVGGFVNMLSAAKDAQVRGFVYAASSSTYGDHAALPKREEAIGQPLSPYAVSKYVDELYAAVFARAYDFKCVGLRYFNVFGPRQDPLGAYAAVIPSWLAAMLAHAPVWINGDGSTSRDFTFVDNVVQANILAAVAVEDARDQIYNVACGNRLTLTEVFDVLVATLAEHGVIYRGPRRHRAFRPGDVLHSQADISKAKRLLGYAPTVDFAEGIARTVASYCPASRIGGPGTRSHVGSS
ncbi:MAG TPA: SDR family oxidoreductase [Caulobacteraceae bacterium]